MKDILIRSVKTFFQGFLGSLVVFLQGNSNIDEKVLKSALIGALSAGLCAVMNYVIKLLEKE